MTPDEYRRKIELLGLSQVQAGKFLTDNPRTSRGWALGEHRIPKAVAMLLRLMVRLKLKREDVER